MSCSICLSSIRKTRSTTELPCGHLYHKTCIGKWESRGNETCPLCRQHMSNNKFRVTLKIENLKNNNNNIINISFSDIQDLIERMGITEEELDIGSTDIVFDAEDLESLQSILADLGVSSSNIDSSVLNTE